MGLRLGSTRIPGITLYEEGKAYPKGLVNIDASVPPTSSRGTATIATTGNSVGAYVRYPGKTGKVYYTAGETFEITAEEILYLYAEASRTWAEIQVNGVKVAGGGTSTVVNYTYSVPEGVNISIELAYGNPTIINIVETSDMSDSYDVTNYAFAKVTNIPKPVDYFTQYATDTLISYSNSNVTNLPSSIFYGRSSLKEVNFPACTTINNYAFYSCWSLATASFPVCTSIGSSAFYDCWSLTTANFPSCTSMGGYAFYSCSSLTTANFPSCISIGIYAFYQCSSLATAYFSSCTTVNRYAFFGCISLSTVSLPVCTSIGNNAFTNCSALTSVNFPSCSSIGNSVFTECYSLSTVSLPVCTSIGSYVFRNCYNLLSLYLLGSSLCSLLNTNAFSGTPISTYTTSTGGVHGLIWVPESLYSLYISSTNWVNYSDRIVIFEG